MAQWTDANGVSHNTDNLAYGDQGDTSYAPAASGGVDTPSVRDYSYDPWADQPSSPTWTPMAGWGGVPGGAASSSSPAPAAPAAPTTVAGVNPITGQPGQYTPEEWAQIRADYDRMSAEQKRQTGVAEGQAQFQLDTARADQVANAAYQQSMIQYNNAQLAQAAADSARRNDIAAQQAETASRAQIADAAYQTGTLANQSFANQATAAYQTGTLDINRAAQVATAAYQQAIIAGNSATLAATIADNAARNEISRQQAETARAGQVSQSAYQQGATANAAAATANEAQFRGMSLAQSSLETQQTRRQRRPYRPLRVSVA